MGTKIMHRPGRALVLFAALLVASAQTAVVAVASESDPWEYSAGLYAWGAGIGGKTVEGDEIDLSLSDIIDNLHMIFFGEAGMRKKDWGLHGDLIYLNIGAANSGTTRVPVGPDSIPVDTDVNISLKAWVFTPTVHYTLVDTEKNRFDILGGLRYLYLDARVELDEDLPIAGERSQTLEDSGPTWDGIVGFKGRYNIDDKWYLPYYADVGTGESKITWQAFGGVGYKFSKVDTTLGYRYLKWEFDDNDALDNLNVSGLLLGFNYKF